ncbi:hypothetical protein [Insolitispirillum peregrinum]|uniref:Uncharacterized protein n=1 Tax=Insolitispirillum peregrinum TaxID=80876 RepID=A0A1N7LSC7_9PROT|nr:hypothetical protein [Insolitispirillum peregrinum]SIS76736.1 hypothetical protein SAMN05421779_103527 [Insolitispirillum peregrinum]
MGTSTERVRAYRKRLRTAQDRQVQCRVPAGQVDMLRLAARLLRSADPETVRRTRNSLMIVRDAIRQKQRADDDASAL